MAAATTRPSSIAELPNHKCRSQAGWATAVLAATGCTGELVRVPDDLLPPDLRAFGSWRQHLLVSSEKAYAVLGWRHAEPGPCIAASVRWHLQHPPPEPDTDFAADDVALRARLRPGG